MLLAGLATRCRRFIVDDSDPHPEEAAKRPSRRMQAGELPRGNASASPFETRRSAAFLRVRGKLVRADIVEGAGV